MTITLGGTEEFGRKLRADEHGFTDGFNMAVQHLSGVKLVPKEKTDEQKDAGGVPPSTNEEHTTGPVGKGAAGDTDTPGTTKRTRRAGGRKAG